MYVYIASGWFNKQQQDDVEGIKKTLEKLDIKYYSPKDHNLCSPDAPMHKKMEVVKENIHKLNQVDLVIVNTRDKDMGTIFEAGYAHCLSVPIIYYCQGLKGQFNLMLAQTGRAVATSYTGLQNHVYAFKSNRNYVCQYKGDIE